ncbi:hypothetical protein FGO68_gene14571 [Halteria grandinella]|uniref:Uncharacterized protein n=1 Tax=Halteria grandinella TaxID=5974 RepID=A0A8J8SY88_HALGN|nr:hypothetical protein FGO68_gene14571 [Halteria grandinella]
MMLHNYKMEQSNKLYGYGTDGEKDHGWGCSYRSAQNIMSHNNFTPVPSLKIIVKLANREWGSWAEPADFMGIFGSRATTLAAGISGRLFQYTKESQYLEKMGLEVLYEKIINGCKEGKSYMIDDGNYAYAVVSSEGQAKLIDPHVNEEVGKVLQAVVLKEELILSKKGWMVLEVNQND